jgi:hypothetical protein
MDRERVSLALGSFLSLGGCDDLSHSSQNDLNTFHRKFISVAISPLQFLLSRDGGYEFRLATPRSFPESRSPKFQLAVCVPPLYWFSDWLQLIQFVEIWRSFNRVSHFFVYFQSISEQVDRVLRVYEQMVNDCPCFSRSVQGLVTIIPWSLLPSDTDTDPNLSVYRLGHSLAHNDCLYRADSRFVALVDVDEYLLTG